MDVQPDIYSVKEIVGDARSGLFAVADTENQVRVFDAKAGRRIAKYQKDKRAAWCGLGGVGGGKLFASAMINTGMCAYDLALAGAVVWRRRDLTSSSCVVLDSMGKRLIVGGEQRPLQVLDAHTGETLVRVNGARVGAFVPGSADLAVAGSGWIGLIDGNSGKARWRRKNTSWGCQAISASEEAVFATTFGATFHKIEPEYSSVEISPSGALCYDLHGKLLWASECPPHRFYNDLAYRAATKEIVAYRSAANASDFHVVTSNAAGESLAAHAFPRLAHAAIFDEGRLFATSDGEVLDTQTMKRVFRFAISPSSLGMEDNPSPIPDASP